MKKLSNKGQWQILFASPWVLLGLAIFILLIIGLVMWKIGIVVGLFLIIIGGVVFLRTMQPYVPLVFILIGALFIWNPLNYLGLNSTLAIFVPNQQAGINIDIDAPNTVIESGGSFNPEIGVIFSEGSWYKPETNGFAAYFVDGLFYKSTNWDLRCLGSSSRDREFIVLDEFVSVSSSSGKHNLTVLAVQINPDDCTNFEPDTVVWRNNCLNSLNLQPGITTVDSAFTAVNLCEHITYKDNQIKKKTIGYLINGIETPGPDCTLDSSCPKLSFWEKIVAWFKSLSIKFI